jgi:Ca-activated chloride channel family protein
VSFALPPLSLFTKQNIEVKGKVVDARSGEGVAFAIVKAKNSQITTTAAEDGTFTLVVPDNAKIIEVTAVGYQVMEIPVTPNLGYLTIKLKLQEHHLDEVVVSAYGNTRDAPETQLQGRAAGITVQKGRHRRQLNAQRQFNTEDYDAITENRFVEAAATPLSTFSIDVDGASYSNVRRFLNQDQLPPAGSVRVEEMINYFRYDYPQPANKHPFSINTEAAACPWNKDHQLVMIGLQGRRIDVEKLPPTNLVFLIDVSGSMTDENKLPLVKSSLKLLTEQLREQDKVSMVVYAGSAGLVLPSTSGSNKQKIVDAIDELEAGGSTAGGAGIKLAYKVAQDNFVRQGNNRVILCTDGDFNIGVSSDAELERLIEHERESGVFLTVLGYGMGNYKDNKMQKLADKGNGNHSYIDNLQEAKKVLVNEFGGTLFTIAKDVKLQVEFNPNVVQAYRLVGYENRLLNKEDFNNDKKDAGDIGSGHTVTALYEIIPVGVKSTFIESVDALKYQSRNYKPVKQSDEIMNVKIRYKQPDGSKSVLLEQPVLATSNEKPSGNFRFATAVAQYGMILNKSAFKQNSSFSNARKLAAQALGNDTEGYRKEFLKLIDKAEELMEEDLSLNK